MHLVITQWQHDTADLRREEQTREASPASFFFSQGQALVLAAKYFTDARLVKGARGGVARKHRHRMQLALYGQLLASLEYLFKDFIAALLTRFQLSTSGSGPPGGSPSTQTEFSPVALPLPVQARCSFIRRLDGTSPRPLINERYKHLFQREPVEASEVGPLKRLWILRHSVAHNAGFITDYDSVRGDFPALSRRVADLQPVHLDDSFEFLCRIARRVADTVGDRIVVDWLKTRVPQGKSYVRDRVTYKTLKLLATFVNSRAQDLPSITKGSCTDDYTRAAGVGAA